MKELDREYLIGRIVESFEDIGVTYNYEALSQKSKETIEVAISDILAKKSEIAVKVEDGKEEYDIFFSPDIDMIIEMHKNLVRAND